MDLIQQMTERLPEELTREQRNKATQLLTKFANILQGRLWYWKTPHVEFHIDTGESHHQATALATSIQTHLEMIEQQITKMQEQGKAS